jgi:predicted small lipoprotein YifL
MILNRELRGSVALALLVSLTACYTQRPLEVPVPTASTRIVASVSDSGTVAMSNAIGPGAVEIEGVVAAADADVWNLHLMRVEHRDGRSIPWNRELVSFPRNALARPMERRLDRTKSWLAAAGIAAAALIVGRVFQTLATDDRRGGDPPPLESVIPAGGRRE